MREFKITSKFTAIPRLITEYELIKLVENQKNKYAKFILNTSPNTKGVVYENHFLKVYNHE